MAHGETSSRWPAWLSRQRAPGFLPLVGHGLDREHLPQVPAFPGRGLWRRGPRRLSWVPLSALERHVPWDKGSSVVPPRGATPRDGRGAQTCAGIAAPFAIAGGGREPGARPCVRAVEYDSAPRRSGALIRAAPWVNLERIVLGDGSQHTRPCVFRSCAISKWQTHRDGMRTAGCQGWGQRDTERLLRGLPFGGMGTLCKPTWGITAHAGNVPTCIRAT